MSVEFELGTKFNDVLTGKVIETWEGENVILNGATGSGKTYFTMNNLYIYCSGRFNNRKRMLFLCNRYALFKEILLEKEKLGLNNMDVLLYQTLEELIRKKEPIDRYECIILDEFHHVLESACYDYYTDLSYDWIIGQTQAIKIFMSGTGTSIFNKLKFDKIVKEEFEYIIPYDYSYADIKIYHEHSKVFDIINNILLNTDEKLIYFANNTDKALEVFNQFKEECCFRCSENNNSKEAEKYNDIECIKAYNKDLITFDKRVLITTKVLDNGINIKDKKIKHIICDVFDFDSSQQCLGRKRLMDKDDKCTFYIHDYGKKALRNFKGNLMKKFNPVKLFIKNKEEFHDKYDNNRTYHSDFIFHNDNDERVYNKLAYWKMLIEEGEITMSQENGYANTFIERLGDTVNSVKELEELEEYEFKNEIELYLIDLKGKRLFKEEQDELIKMIDLKDKTGRQLTSHKILNTYIQENFNLTLTNGRDRKKRLPNGDLNKDYNKRYWLLIDERVD